MEMGKHEPSMQKSRVEELEIRALKEERANPRDGGGPSLEVKRLWATTSGANGTGGSMWRRGSLVPRPSPLSAQRVLRMRTVMRMEGLV